MLLRLQGYSMQEVARRLGRAAPTISQELRRNGATRSGNLEYPATTEQWYAERAARRPKQPKLAKSGTLRAYVEDRLAGAVIAPNGAPVPGPTVCWKGRWHGPRREVGRYEHGARSRLPGACRSTFRKMRICVSAMKPSIKRHSFKLGCAAP